MNPRKPSPGFPQTRTGQAARNLVRRRTGWVAMLAFIPAVAVFVVQLTSWSNGKGLWAPAFQFVYWMPMYLSIFYNQVAARRFHGKLAAHDYRLCCFCGYDLRNIPDFGRCPECGQWYDVRVTRQEWTSEGPPI